MAASMLLRLLLFVLINIKLCNGDISDIQTSLEIVSPGGAYSLISGLEFQMSIKINLLQSTILPSHDAQLCVTKHDMPLAYPVRIDMNVHRDDYCVLDNNITVIVELFGSYLMKVYLRVSDVNEDGSTDKYMISCVEGLFQTIDVPVYLPAHQIKLAPEYDYMDSVTVFKEVKAPSTDTSSLHPLTKIIGQDHVISNRNRKLHTFPRNSKTCTSIAFFVKELQYHGANNRLFHWLFDNDRFEENGYCLSVITGKTDSAHNEDLLHRLESARIPVHQFDCLDSLSDINDPFIKESFDLLVNYLQSQMDVVIAVNTFIHSVTTTLVQAVTHAKVNNTNKPYLFFDLANIPLDYRDFDGIIAPSRFAGLNVETVALGKSIAVIYPPACSLKWIVRSPCYSVMTSSEEGIDESTLPDSRHARTIVDISRFSKEIPEVVPYLAVETEDKILKVKFLMVSRLEVEKCPAVLLHVIRHIRSSLTPEELLDFESQVEFNIYGEGPLLNALMGMRDSFELQSLVHFKGTVSEDEMIEVMRSSDALINPRLTGETFGFVHSEASVMGLPIIAFKAGANEETISSGFLIDPHGDVMQDFSTAIIALYQVVSSTSNKVSRCEKARTRIAQWNIHRHSDSLMDAIRTVVQ